MPDDATEGRLRHALESAASRVSGGQRNPADLRAVIDANRDNARPWKLTASIFAITSIMIIIAGASYLVASSGGGSSRTAGSGERGDSSNHAPVESSRAPTFTTKPPSGVGTKSGNTGNNVPGCTTHALKIAYRAGSEAAGNNFGSIQIVNVSNAPCALNGSMTIEPLDDAGSPMKVLPGWNNRLKFDDVILTAHGALPGANGVTQPGQHWAEVMLGGDARDNPAAANGLCAADDVVTPARWKLGGIVSRIIPNLDTSAPSGHGGISACSKPSGLHLLAIRSVVRS